MRALLVRNSGPSLLPGITFSAPDVTQRLLSHSKSRVYATAHGTSEFVWALDFIRLWAQSIERRIFPVNLDLKTRTEYVRAVSNPFYGSREWRFARGDVSVLGLLPESFSHRAVVSKNRRELNSISLREHSHAYVHHLFVIVSVKVTLLKNPNSFCPQFFTC